MEAPKLHTHVTMSGVDAQLSIEHESWPDDVGRVRFTLHVNPDVKGARVFAGTLVPITNGVPDLSFLDRQAASSPMHNVSHVEDVFARRRKLAAAIADAHTAIERIDDYPDGESGEYAVAGTNIPARLARQAIEQGMADASDELVKIDTWLAAHRIVPDPVAFEEPDVRAVAAPDPGATT